MWLLWPETEVGHYPTGFSTVDWLPGLPPLTDTSSNKSHACSAFVQEDHRAERLVQCKLKEDNSTCIKTFITWREDDGDAPFEKFSSIDIVTRRRWCVYLLANGGKMLCVFFKLHNSVTELSSNISDLYFGGLIGNRLWFHKLKGQKKVL